MQPADCRLYEAVNVSIDQASLTGESLPVSKSVRCDGLDAPLRSVALLRYRFVAWATVTDASQVGDQCFSGSTCKVGEGEGIVTATGTHTLFGRAAALVGQDDEPSHLQVVMSRIGTFCLGSIGLFIALELIILFGVYRYDYRRGLDQILVLLVGGIRASTPSLTALTMQRSACPSSFP